MAERPIIFSAPMVRALLEGKKTQTRRIIKPPYGTLEYMADGTWKPIFTKVFPGDRLWLREAWRQAYAKMPFSEGIVYRADKVRACGMDEYSDRHKWGSPIHMPRKFSRLTLTVTDVRVQRLQDISEEDAKAEGCAGRLGPNPDFPDEWDPSPQEEFQALWQSIHGPGSWEATPWVAAITFTVEQRNIDEGAR